MVRHSRGRLLLVCSDKETHMANILLAIGTLLATVSFVPYIRDIIRHGSRPRLVSWMIWTILLTLMAIVSVQEHQWGSALITTVSAVGCFTVVVLGRRYATRGTTQLEKGVLVAAVAGIALWLVVDNPLLVMLVAITVDAVAYLPTVVHAWQDPDEESWRSYFVGGLGEVLILVAVVARHADTIGVLYPAYAAVMNLAIVGVIFGSAWWYGKSDELAIEPY